MSIIRVKVFVLVKTYPVLSQKYGELVCTAGVTDQGTWIRLYPLPFRLLQSEKKYSKYQWIEVDVEKNESDHRPESYKVINVDTIKLLEKIDTSHGWRERKKFLFKYLTIYTSVADLINLAQQHNTLSLALFKPKKIKKFIIEDCDKEWDVSRLGQCTEIIHQTSLFDTVEEREKKETFKIVKKIPYKFSYTFIDSDDSERTLMIEDWEIGELYWNCLKDSQTEEIALQKVKQKYYTEFLTKDTYLFLGTTKQYNDWAKNPFIIIGLFYPPKEIQQEFDIFNDQ